MAHGFRIHAFGRPDVMMWEDIELGDPGPGEALVRHLKAGVNFFDIYTRRGLEKGELPMGLGIEAVGVVEAIGDGVSEVAVGDRVAYGPVIGGALGAYSEARIVPAWRLLRVPDAVSDEVVAAAFLKGMTAQYLLKQIGQVGPGDTILFHAAAGGVGLIAGQWAKALGARAIGTAGGPQKVEAAKAAGYDHVIDYRSVDFVDAVKELTDGEGVRIVFDSVGKDTLEGSLKCLRECGMLVCFGAASGSRPPLDIETLSHHGSLYLTRPTLRHYAGTREKLEYTGGDLLNYLASGDVDIRIAARLPLKDAPQAHERLEGRSTIGAIVLEV